MQQRLSAEKMNMMAETPIRKLIPKFALPTIIAQLINNVYNLVDTYFVSLLGTDATAAVSVNGSLGEITALIGSLLGMGACSYIARLLGAGEKDKAGEVLSTSFFTGIVLGLILMAAGLFSVERLVYLLGATEECAAYSVQYARYTLLASPLMVGNFILNACLRSEGSANRAMLGISLGGVLNCFLDPLFIFGLDLGVEGASIATAISKAVSFCILIFPYVRKKCTAEISLRRVRFTKTAAREVVSIGSTSFLRSVLMVFGAVIINRVAGRYSTSALAAISVAVRVMTIPFCAILGFGQGYQPVVGFGWGAKQSDRLREGLRFSLAVSAVSAVLFGGLLFVFAAPVIRVFNSEADAEVVRLGVLSVRLQCIALPIQSWLSVINMFYAGIGDARCALLISTSRQGYCLIPMVVILPLLFGVEGIAVSQAAADILTLALALPLTHRAFRLIGSVRAEKYKI